MVVHRRSGGPHRQHRAVAEGRGFLAALAHPEASTWRDVATSVLSEAGRIERIVEDLLLLARLDEGVPSVAVVDIGSIVRDAARRAGGGTGGTAGIHLTVEDGLVVQGREDDLTSVVRNLLDNAVRHAGSTVAVTAAAGNGAVIITVDDDGPGIPAPDRERVFERFTRLDPARGSAEGGVGLGLAVVDRVVRQLGGSVEATESPIGGARLIVQLPAAPHRGGRPRSIDNGTQS